MSPPLILGDWGTTSCRLWLVAAGRVRDGVTGPGIKFCGDPAATFATLTANWRTAHGDCPTLLCGTVGANIGWVDAGYTLCPATLEDICDRAVGIDGVLVLPGVRTDANAFGHPDVMRSEEVQVFGWMAEANSSHARLCLPGSHTKWVEVVEDRIAKLTTGFVGELFETLRAGSILVAPSGSGRVELGEAFNRGVAIGHSHPSLLSAMFGVRAGSANNTLSAQDARDRLSGLLVGADCAAMLEAWQGPPDAVIGDGAVARAYVHALSRLGHRVPHFEGERAVLSGLMRAADHLAERLGRTGGLGTAAASRA